MRVISKTIPKVTYFYAIHPHINYLTHFPTFLIFKFLFTTLPLGGLRSFKLKWKGHLCSVLGLHFLCTESLEVSFFSHHLARRIARFEIINFTTCTVRWRNNKAGSSLFVS